MKGRARELRVSSTPAEQALWERLRNRRCHGLRFRRQHTVGIFITDFYCHELKLVVELDGGVHSDPRQIAHDQNRDIYLSQRGLKVLRFPNQQVFESPEVILNAIAQVAQRPSPPDPLSHPHTLPPGEGNDSAPGSTCSAVQKLSISPPLPAGGCEDGRGGRGVRAGSRAGPLLK